MYLIGIRSHAVATYLVGQGIDPVDAVIADDRLVFRFPPEAETLIDRYNHSKAKLDSLARVAKPIGGRS